MLDAGGIQQPSADRLRQLRAVEGVISGMGEQPRQRVDVPLEGRFGVIDQLPAPVAPIHAAVVPRVRIEILRSENPAAAGVHLLKKSVTISHEDRLHPISSRLNQQPPNDNQAQR